MQDRGTADTGTTDLRLTKWCQEPTLLYGTVSHSLFLHKRRCTSLLRSWRTQVGMGAVPHSHRVSMHSSNRKSKEYQVVSCLPAIWQ